MVTDGQSVNAAVTNAAFMSRIIDTSTAGKVDLENPDNDTIEGVQRMLLEVAESLGVDNRLLTDATSDTYSSNNIVTNGDDRKVAIGKLDAEFDSATGHNHDGTAGSGGTISIVSVADINQLYAEWVEATFDAAAGLDDDVSALFAAETPGGDAVTEGVPTVAPNNYISIVEKTSYTELEDGSGNRVYGRLTEAAGVWTLSYYVVIAGVETAHSLSANDIRFIYRKVFNQADRPTFGANVLGFDSLNPLADIPDASPSVRGVVSTAAQSFAGIKDFEDGLEVAGIPVVDEVSVQTVANKDLEDCAIITPTRLDVKQDTLANLTAYATTATDGQIVFATDTLEMFQIISNALEPVGGGGGGAGGGLSIARQFDAEDDDVTGFTNIVTTTTDPIHGSYSYEVSSYPAELPAVTLDDRFTNDGQGGKTLSVELHARIASGTATFQVVDNAANVLETVDFDSTVTQRVVLAPFIQAGVTSLTLEILDAGSATDLIIDDIVFSDDPVLFANVANLTDWSTPTTITIGAVTTPPTKGTIGVDAMRHRRVGPNVEIEYTFRQTTAGTTGTGGYLLPLPTGMSWPDGTTYSSPTARNEQNSIAFPGFTITTPTTVGAVASAIPYDATRFWLLIDAATTDAGAGNSSTMDPWGSVFGALNIAGLTFKGRMSVPIKGWTAYNESIVTPQKGVDTFLRLQTGNGHGSANTKVRRFLTTIESYGTGFIYADSATLGASITIVERNEYTFCLTDRATTGVFGFSKNSNQLTTNIESITAAHQLAYTATTGGTNFQTITWKGFLNPGDVIRVHTNSSGFLDGGQFLTVSSRGFNSLSATPLPKTAVISDTRAANTAGGTATSGSHETVTLNTVEGDTSIVSLGSNQVTLFPGTYVVTGRVPGYQVDSLKSRLRNITLGSTTKAGSSERAGAASGVQAVSTFTHQFTLTTNTVFELQRRVGTTSATNGAGFPANLGENEVYGELVVTKIK